MCAKKTIGVVAVLAAILSSFGGPHPVCVQPAEGYNCWPMIQSVRGKLVCVYTSGMRHDPGERGRGTFARTSSDGGRTWSARVTVAQDPKKGQTPVAKGLDETGDMLVWVRCYGGGPLMALYRTKDGSSFERVAEPALDKGPMMQITDVFRVPKVGLMSFWFGGSYADDDRPRRWGTMTSRDNGKTWEQRVCGENMRRADWPTEPSGFALDDGRIFCMARTEGTTGQMQLTSLDSGKTWTVRHTNILDVKSSTPSLLYDAKTDVVYNYYYQRGPGKLKRRSARLADIFEHPEEWPVPETLVDDGGQEHHAGNVNATFLDGRQFVAWYTGNERNCSVMVMEVSPVK